MPKVAVLIDFYGTVTQKTEADLDGVEFYRSLFSTYGPSFKTLKYTPETQRLLEEKFGTYEEPFKDEQKDAGLLMTPGAVKFLHQLLKNKDVEISIFTNNDEKYIQMLLQYQGFSPEEMRKLKIKAFDDKYEKISLECGFYQMRSDKPNVIYIMDDNETEYNDMFDAAVDAGFSESQVHAYNLPADQFNWESYQEEIEKIAPPEKTPLSRPFVMSTATLKFSSPDESQLSPNEMAIAVDTVKAHAAKKSFSFNCAVLAAVKNDVSELENFLLTLEKNKNSYPDNTRIQYLFGHQASDERMHWTTTDIRIKDGNLEFYLLDAASVTSGLIQQIALIQKIFPNAVVRSSELLIQKDSENCAWFALDHAMGLAKIPDLHEQLASIPEASVRVRDDEDSSAQFKRYGQLILEEATKKRNLLIE
jgi:hypothetical protein